MFVHMSLFTYLDDVKVLYFANHGFTDCFNVLNPVVFQTSDGGQICFTSVTVLE